ncbi:complex III assembly factor LYRM7 [Salminus brasiliensis]|uniref:complex III assembly factor LYRM7 n=1 Tax=Salminus brasiliensis TaxID=930266 RepID=UPI003B831E26
MLKMGTRLKVLRVFKALHRTRMTVFKDDDRALTAARLKINEEFKKNKNETSEENVQEMIKMGRAVETILRENVMQAEHIGEKTLVLRPRESNLLDNMPYCDAPRKKT